MILSTSYKHSFHNNNNWEYLKVELNSRPMGKPIYSLRKSRKILRSYHSLFRRKEEILSNHQKERIDQGLRNLDRAVLEGEREEASKYAKELIAFFKQEGLRSSTDVGREVGWAIVFAIAVAFLIRQFWFELYEVPTGSMRPTILELDRLAVSKTTFGIHLPFRKEALFYHPDLIQRAGIIVLTTAGLDMDDPNMLYFGLFPGKKRFVKRCVNQPGDTLYFYGGYIYAVDKEGKGAMELADPHFLEEHKLSKIDHVPMITFEGKTELSQLGPDGVYHASTIKQMNLPVVKLTSNEKGEVEGLFFNGQQWVKDDVNGLKKERTAPVSYSDLWGMGNFAMARLLDRADMKKLYGVATQPNIPLYLELYHTPSATYPQPVIRRGERGETYPMLKPFTTIIPLNQEHLERLQQTMITSRFCVKKGRAYPYQKGRKRPQPIEFDIRLPQVSDGCYEFYYGKGYRVEIGGFRRALPESHGLYSLDPSVIKSLFNAGIGWNRLFEPMGAYQPYIPHRYAYYRDGDLYLMGAPFLRKEDPTLVAFVANEFKKETNSTALNPYIAFVDRGPPLLENGSLDIDKILAFGLKVPDDHVVGLGDNYAMSADSREFGFVPVDNLRGAPSFIFWPVSHRLGALAQPPYPWITIPNLVIWILAAIVILLCWIYYRKRNNRSLFD